MKVTFEQLKAAFNRVLISRGVDSETADACAEMFARTTESANVWSIPEVDFRAWRRWGSGRFVSRALPEGALARDNREPWDKHDCA